MKFSPKKFLVNICYFLLITNTTYSFQNEPETILLNGKNLLQIKNVIQNNPIKTKAYNDLIKKANSILKKGTLYSVMNKKQTPPSGNKHDYMSTGPYWWPDPSKPDGLPYIRKDGQRNPEYNEITDSNEMDKLETDCEILALAYYFSNDEKYSEFAAKLIKNWFINPDTKQNPNLNFGQGIKGKNTGRGTGLIETRELGRIIDASILLKNSKHWPSENQTELKKWFSEFLDWMINSDIGKDEADEYNNHGTYYSMQVINFAIFSNKTDIALKEIVIAKERLNSQIEKDGSQPHELKRTKSWGYVTMNLLGFCEIAILSKKLNVDFFNYKTKKNVNILLATEWMIPFLKGEKKWTYEQIEPRKNKDAIKILLHLNENLNIEKYKKLAEEADSKEYLSYQNQLLFK
jgi:hypothetical protein